jgi:ABC-2 type transport system ATP-binding protein
VARGETVALLGPNGAGKSTAVSILLGLRKPDAGAVSVLGGAPRTAVAAGRVGALLQSSGLPQGVTVREVVQLARHLSPHPAPMDELLAKAGLESFAERRVDGLSGGQAQRVRYAFAIAGNAEILFLDEPTVGMDVETQRDFWKDMRAHAAAGRTVLFATHYLHEAESVADRVVVLRSGRVVADGPPSTIKAAAGRKSVRFTLADAQSAVLRNLAGVEDVEIHGSTVALDTKDADATVVALVRGGIAFKDIEVTGADLEDAFLALTAED